MQIAETVHDMKVWNSETIDMEVLGLSLFPFNETCCRYVGMISPDITISNHRLRWAVDGMRFTAPLLEIMHWNDTFAWNNAQKWKTWVISKNRSFTSIQMVHTHTPPQWGIFLSSRKVGVAKGRSLIQEWLEHFYELTVDFRYTLPRILQEWLEHFCKLT